MRGAGEMFVVLSWRLFDSLNSPETSSFPPAPLNRSGFLGSAFLLDIQAHSLLFKDMIPKDALVMQDRTLLGRIKVLAPKLIQEIC